MHKTNPPLSARCEAQAIELLGLFHLTFRAVIKFVINLVEPRKLFFGACCTLRTRPVRGSARRTLMYKNATLSYPEVLLSSTQVQHMLGLSRTSVWRLTRHGGLQPVHIGTALRFRRSDVLALMQIGTTQHPTQKSPLSRA